MNAYVIKYVKHKNLTMKSRIKFKSKLNFQMGYAQLKQKGDGIHLRQFSRAFIIQNDLQRLIFVSVDAAMMTHPVKRDVNLPALIN